MTTANGGRLITSDDKGDGTASAPELCTSTSYATSATAPRLNYRSRQLTVRRRVRQHTDRHEHRRRHCHALTTATRHPGRWTIRTTRVARSATSPAPRSSTTTAAAHRVYVTTSNGTFDGYGRELTAPIRTPTAARPRPPPPTHPRPVPCRPRPSSPTRWAGAPPPRWTRPAACLPTSSTRTVRSPT